MIISFIAAGLQALTAVALVSLLLFGLNASGLQVNAWSNQLESVSYAMIALVGLYLLTTRACCGYCGAGEAGPRRMAPKNSLRTVMPSIDLPTIPCTTPSPRPCP